MLFEYLKIINYNIKSCIKHFIMIIKLSYAYIMKQCISERVKMLKIEDIHFHWRFEKFIRDHYEVIVIEGDNKKNVNVVNKFLRVNESTIIKFLNRFLKTKNKKRTRVQIFKNFI